MFIGSFRSNEGSTLENKLLSLNPHESSKTWLGKLQGLERERENNKFYAFGYLTVWHENF